MFVSTYYVLFDPYRSGRQDLPILRILCIRARTRCFQVNLSGQFPSQQAQVSLFETNGSDLSLLLRCMDDFLFSCYQKPPWVCVCVCMCVRVRVCAYVLSSSPLESKMENWLWIPILGQGVMHEHWQWLSIHAICQY